MHKAVFSESAPAAIGPYSQAVLTGKRLYTSGQVGLDAKSGNLPEAFVEQAERVMENIGHILEEAGYSFNDVVKSTVFMTDLGKFTVFNDIYARYFTGVKPARSCVQVAALPKGAQVEVEVVAEKA